MKNIIALILPLLLACGVMTPLPASMPTESPTGVNTETHVTTAPTGTDAPDVRRVAAERLNVRSCPSTACEGVGILYSGQSVTVVYVDGNDWCKLAARRWVACWWLE